VVARFHARCLGRIILTIVLAAGLVNVAHGDTSESGQAALQRYEEAKAKQQEALAKGDSKAFETLKIEVSGAMVVAEGAFKRQYDSAKGLDNTLGYMKVLRLKGDHDLASEIAAETLDDGIESAILWREYGACLLTMGPKQRQKGIDALYKSLEQDKASQEAVPTWNELGAYYLRSVMPVPAATAYAAALAIDNSDVRAQLGQLVVDVYNGEIAQAGTRLAAVGREAQPYDTALRAQLRLALKDFDIHRRSFSDTAENHYAYARLLYSAARLPEAIMAAQRAARLARTDIGIWNFLAAIQMQMGDYPGAQKSYEASLRANANQPNIQQAAEKLKEAQQNAAQQAVPGAGKGPLR
jgi:tetratricopeptide (TPR) repeat protein